jgi:hypothetical protein
VWRTRDSSWRCRPGISLFVELRRCKPSLQNNHSRMLRRVGLYVSCSVIEGALAPMSVSCSHLNSSGLVRQRHICTLCARIETGEESDSVYIVKRDGLCFELVAARGLGSCVSWRPRRSGLIAMGHTGMLTLRCTMASNTGVASELLPVDDHVCFPSPSC